MMIEKNELVQALENVCKGMADRKMDTRFRDGFTQAIIMVKVFSGLISQDEAETTRQDPGQPGSSVVKMKNILNSEKEKLFYLEERGCDKMIAVTAELDCEDKRTLNLTTQGDMTAGTVIKRHRNDYCKQWRLWDGRPGKKERSRLSWF